MSEYIIDICADDGFKAEIKEKLIRCGRCAYHGYDDGRPWCILYDVLKNDYGFCDFGAAKTEDCRN